MTHKTKYYIVEQTALPEVFLKVVEAKKLIESQTALTVQDAVDMVGISRSSFYKYKDSISPFYEYSRGKNITIGFKLDDAPGVLSEILTTIAQFSCNVLTIHQSIPINGVADVTISVELVGNPDDMGEIVETLSEINGVHRIKIIARE